MGETRARSRWTEPEKCCRSQPAHFVSCAEESLRAGSVRYVKRTLVVISGQEAKKWLVTS